MRQTLKSNFWDGTKLWKRGEVIDWPEPLAVAEPVPVPEPEAKPPVKPAK